MKLALIKIYRKILTNPKYAGKVQFLSTIHDEVNLSINYEDRELFLEIFKQFNDCMYCSFKGWDVPFDIGLEIGTKWGDSFVFKYDNDGNLVPEMDYVPLNDNVVKEDIIEEVVEEVEDTFEFDLEF